MTRSARVGDVLLDLMARPQQLVRRWHWKSALCSTTMRTILFFVVNLSAGLDAATAAAATECVYRAVTAGFYGALTQTLRMAEPAWLAALTAMVLLPGVGHVLEAGVHWYRGTTLLAASVAASVTLSVISTLFNLYAMRRGALVVHDADAASLLSDLRSLPGLVVGFVRVPFQLLGRP